MLVKIEIPNLIPLTERLHRFPEISAPVLQQAIARSLVAILGEIKKPGGAPVGVTAALRDSWNVQYRGLKGTLRSNVPYSVGIEKGTKPHWPNVEELAPWAKKKGLNPWAVAHSIAKKGTKANPFLERSIDSASAQVISEFKDALSVIMIQIAKN